MLRTSTQSGLAQQTQEMGKPDLPQESFGFKMHCFSKELSATHTHMFEFVLKTQQEFSSTPKQLCLLVQQ